MKIGDGKGPGIASWLLIAAVLFSMETPPTVRGVMPKTSFTPGRQPMIERAASQVPRDTSPHSRLAPLYWNTNCCRVPIQHVATESIKPQPLVPAQPKPLTPMQPQPLIVTQPKPFIPTVPKPLIPIEPKPLVPVSRP
jgi:hypothetical protein